MNRLPRFALDAILTCTVGLALAHQARAQTTTVNTCATCHASLAQADLASPPKAVIGDVHDRLGIRCIDCHGGDSTASDKAAAHSPAGGYRGRPAGAQIIAVCSRCHNDAELMHKFSPRQRVDQAAEYASSVHGKRLAAGDTRVATCVSCHSAHGVRLVNDVRSPVYPTNVAATCGGCHSSAEHMKGYSLPDGKPLPTSQRADYERSVHYTAMMKQNDLSAPTCNDCHGNHGAAPPGVSPLTAVCGTCHTLFASKFATSIHAQIFDKACIECHSNHAVLAPSDALLGTGSGTVCVNCHTDRDDPGFGAAAKMWASLDMLKQGVEGSTALILQARNAGMEVGDEELALNEARSKLVLARTEVHAFNPASLAGVVGDGMTIIAGVDQAGNKALAELAFRRRGLFASLGVILLVVMALVFKIRDLDRRRTH
jgi:predicted CXXCH cytochrome family protein